MTTLDRHFHPPWRRTRHGHLSWPARVKGERYHFSIVQRKGLTPLDLSDRFAVGERILSFQERCDRTAKPFHWKFTRQDLQERLQALAATKSEN